MNFENIKFIIDGIVDFIKRAAANLEKFITGLKNDVKLNMPATEAEAE